MAKLICDSCCCCFSLRRGCFILGYLQLLGHFAIAAQFVVATVTATDADIRHAEKDTGLPIMGLCAIILLFLAGSLSFNITFLVGLHKTKRRLVLVYLVYMTTLYALLTIAVLVTAIMFKTYVYIIGLVINMVPNVYFLCVIRSYYYKMAESSVSDRGVVYNASPLSHIGRL